MNLKPGISRRYLVFIAAIVWIFAGGMLLTKGAIFLLEDSQNLILKLIFSAVGGVLFYCFLFTKISEKHIRRIFHLKSEHPCLFSFFSVKSYLMMSLMISLGIILRKTGIISHPVLAVIYLTMGVPLTLSAIKFFVRGMKQFENESDSKV